MFNITDFYLSKHLKEIRRYNIIHWGKVMDKKPLIGVSICAVVLLVLVSLTPAVGYQAVQSSVIKTETRQSSGLTCDCDKDNAGVTEWHFPILCAIVLAMIIILSSSPFSNFFTGFILSLWRIYDALGC